MMRVLPLLALLGLAACAGRQHPAEPHWADYTRALQQRIGTP